MVTTDRDNLPPFVTFETAADLLVKLGIDPSATGDSIRYLARIRSATTWPFGDRDGQFPYGKVANARTMDTSVFLKHMEDHPPNPNGRGPDRKPRQRKDR